MYSNGPTIVTNGLVLALDAGDRNSYPGSGTTWSDLAGSNNGTLINGPTFNTGSLGSIVFDGTNDYVIGNLSSTFTGVSSGHTFNIWVKLNVLNKEQHLINLKGSNNGSQFYVTTGPRLGTSNWGDLQGYQGQFQTDVWYMITQTRETNGVANHYVNGEVVATGTLPTFGNASQFVMGNFVNGGSYFLNGYVGNAQIYNRALTPTEITQNYNATKGRFGL